jgi:hypothetical protein
MLIARAITSAPLPRDTTVSIIIIIILAHRFDRGDVGVYG